MAQKTTRTRNTAKEQIEDAAQPAAPAPAPRPNPVAELIAQLSRTEDSLAALINAPRPIVQTPFGPVECTTRGVQQLVAVAMQAINAANQAAFNATKDS